MNTISERGFGRMSRVEVTCGQILDLARQLGPGGKLPTIVELRESFGVSITTLNQAMSELEAQNVVVRRNGVGTYVSDSLGKATIALICDPDLFGSSGSSPFWYLLLRQLRERAAQKEELVQFYWAGLHAAGGVNLDAGLMQDIANRRMDGIVMVGLTPVTTKWIEEQGVPAVGYASPSRWRVRTDYIAMVKMGVEALAQVGCRRIGLWSPVHPWRPYDVVLARQRAYYTVLRAALEDLGLDYDPGLVEDNLHRVEPAEDVMRMTLREQGHATAQKVLGRNSSVRPDGIIITDDVMALGALIGLTNLGLEPGRDIHVASHANSGSSVLHGYEEKIAVLEFDPADLVDALFAHLELLLSGRRPEQAIVYAGPRLVRAGEPVAVPVI